MNLLSHFIDWQAAHVWTSKEFMTATGLPKPTGPGKEWGVLRDDWDVCLTATASVDEGLDGARAEESPAFDSYAHDTSPGSADVDGLKGVCANLKQGSRLLTPSPLQGEHTRSLMFEAGDADVAAYFAAGIVKGPQ